MVSAQVASLWRLPIQGQGQRNPLKFTNLKGIITILRLHHVDVVLVIMLEFRIQIYYAPD